MRTILFVMALGMVALVLFQWQQNARFNRDMVSMRQQLAESDAARQRADHAITTEPADTNLALLRSQNAALSNRAKQLEAELAAAKGAHQPVAAQEKTNPSRAATEDVAHELALAALQGNTAALDTLAVMTRKAVSGNHPNLTSDEQEELTAHLRPIWAAFDLLAEEANQGNENALRALTQAARMPDLSGLAMKSLGALAGQGSEGALNVVLDPQKFGIDVPFASTVGALKPAADNGDPRAIQALAGVATNDTQQPLWFMAASGLSRAAQSGNPAAIDALISFSRSTNQGIINAVRAGLSAAAAQQNQRAIDALRDLSDRQAHR